MRDTPLTRRCRVVTLWTWQLPLVDFPVAVLRAAIGWASNGLTKTLLRFPCRATNCRFCSGSAMPHITARDGTRLYYEQAGEGSAVVFVHEYAGDWRTWEMQMRYFSRAHRCVTYSQRGYPPSDVPDDGAKYSQDIARDDVIALMDALKIDKAHIVGHSMGALTALHVGIHYPKRCISVTAAGCGYGSSSDPKKVEEMRAVSREIGKAFATEGMAVTSARYADGPQRQPHKNKDPRGYAEFARMLSEHSATGHALTMINLQAKRPTLQEMEADLKKFSVPLLIIVGDEDDW